MDKLSYALGLSMGQNFLRSGIKEINVEDFARAFLGMILASYIRILIVRWIK